MTDETTRADGGAWRSIDAPVRGDRMRRVVWPADEIVDREWEMQSWLLTDVGGGQALEDMEPKAQIVYLAAALIEAERRLRSLDPPAG